MSTSSTSVVEFTQQDIDDQRSAARLCESLAEKIAAMNGGSSHAIVTASMQAQAERHRELARRIASLTGD